MKKIYLTGGLVLAGLLATAQTTYKIAKKDIKNGRITHAERVAPSNGSVQQVAGGIICATQYTAGTTMDLSLTYTSANATGDLEYVDYLEITFPAGITPTGAGNTSTTFPNATDAGGGLETLNPAAGQVISWGVQAGTDEYGGIWAPTGETFVVEVNVTAGLTGPQTANFTLDGDGFTGAPGVTTPGVGTTASGTFLINPAGTPAPDLTTTFVQPLSVTTVNNCNYGLDTIVAQIKNTGNTTESNINVMYRVNGGASFTEVVAGPLAPGDSAYVFWLSAPFDFTASNIYNIEAWATATGDINTANDTASQVIVNSQSLALTSAQYNNGVETAYEQNSVIFDGTAAQFTGLSTGTFHSGLVAYFTTVSAANPAGTYEYKAILPCMDVVNGETYRISFWKRTNAASNGNGQTGVFTGLTPTNAGMTTILKAYNATTPLSTWIKDSVDYTATATETRYFAIGGQGVVSATGQMNCRLDDINITKVTPVGVKENTVSAFSVYPNPSNGMFTMNVVNANSSVEVYNVVGEKVYSAANLNKGINSLNLTNLSQGTYFLRVSNGAEVVTKKVTIQ